MLSYPGKLHVASRCGGVLRFATFLRTAGLCLESARDIDSDRSITDQIAECGSGLLLYLLSSDEYSRKNIEFADLFRLDTDPEHIVWEIERRSIVPFHRFRYSLLPLYGHTTPTSLAVFAVSDDMQNRIGESFQGTSLVLHRLIFRPLVLHHAVKTAIGTGFSVAIVSSGAQVDLLFYHNMRLVDLRTMRYDLRVEGEAGRFIDDVGTLAAALFTGVRLSQKLELLFIGLSNVDQLTEQFASRLPYRIESHTLRLTNLCNVGQSTQPENCESYFDLAIAARAFTETEPCESLPVKNAASP